MSFFGFLLSRFTLVSERSKLVLVSENPFLAKRMRMCDAQIISYLSSIGQSSSFSLINFHLNLESHLIFPTTCRVPGIVQSELRICFDLTGIILGVYCSKVYCGDVLVFFSCRW